MKCVDYIVILIICDAMFELSVRGYTIPVWGILRLEKLKTGFFCSFWTNGFVLNFYLMEMRFKV